MITACARHIKTLGQQVEYVHCMTLYMNLVSRDTERLHACMGVVIVMIDPALMMGCRSLITFLFVALFSLIDVAPVYSQRTEDCRLTILVAIKSNDSGLEIRTLFPDPEALDLVRTVSINGDSNNWPNHAGQLVPQVVFISGHYLSSECGEQYFQCQDVLVDTVLVQGGCAAGVLNVVFVPLEKGVLLLSYWYDSNALALKIEWNIVSSSNCTSAAFFKITNDFFMVCVTLSKYFAVYKISLKLNGSVIEDVVLSGHLTDINISNSSLSNIILVDNKICFAVGNTIVVMGIFDSSLPTYQYDQALPQCTQIHKLVPIPDQPLLVLAYCTDKYFLFDLLYGDWTSVSPFSSSGKLYLCPDNDYSASLFTNSTLQLSVRDSLLNTINNVSITSGGVCFESHNKTYFAYSDQQQDYIYVYDFITQKHHPVSSYSCSNVDLGQGCPQLLFLDSEYLVVRDVHYNLVLDTAANFSSIINISRGIADILAVLHVCSNTSSAITPSPPVVHSTTSEKDPQRMGFTSMVHTMPLSTPIFTTWPPTAMTTPSTAMTTARVHSNVSSIIIAPTSTRLPGMYISVAFY